MIELVNTVIQGLLLGGLYALFAAGLSLAFGVMRLVNIAHGDLIILSAFLGYAIVEPLGLNPFWVLIVIVPVMGAIGYVLQRFVLNKTLGDDILPPLLVTFGLSIIIQNTLLQTFSADSRGLNAGDIETASVTIGSISLGVYPLLVLFTAVAVIGGLQYLFNHTSIGRAFRATSDDQSTAQLMGIDNKHIYGLAMAIAMGIVAIAGIYLAIRTNFDPTVGPGRLLYAFEAVIIGGLGSFWGTLAGGMILGVSQAIGFAIDPGWGILTGHLVFLAVLVVKPNGLFPKTIDR
ncbi:High-affinity branched-chain amino acid transport system permease protein LivH [Candidatus Terasakiella magnetica]|uniref:High-affinity branched-chain amino acid transport system permease protein LivH n=1 Tax=Candidatus Terasakiella magnetica TaxID=1867952 RepID=A0A1C3RFN5_9PROT|nr:branched-chain amino acid ABC transporter permease [Candidatus Terasakiella magnetica]SCA56024.1 High-affinity branched-chain amino acid transport system permease protein LivH [Candidatus Terasakiella magnetica]